MTARLSPIQYFISALILAQIIISVEIKENKKARTVKHVFIFIQTSNHIDSYRKDMEKEMSLDHHDSVCWSVILPSFLTHTSSPTQTLPAEKHL